MTKCDTCDKDAYMVDDAISLHMTKGRFNGAWRFCNMVCLRKWVLKKNPTGCKETKT